MSRATTLRRRAAIAAILAVGFGVGMVLGGSATAVPGTVAAESQTDYAEAIAEKQAERAAVDKQLEEIESALEDTSAEIVAANKRLTDLGKKLPEVEAELAAAQETLEEAIREQKLAADKLASAEAEDRRISEAITADEARLTELRAILSEFARAAYRGENTTSTLTIVLGSQTTEDFVDEFAAQNTITRTQGRALAEMEQIAAVNRNRGARQEAVREYIEELKAIADHYVEVAEEARALAEEKKAEIEALVKEQNELKALLEKKKQEFLAEQEELKATDAQIKADLIELIRLQRNIDHPYGDGKWGWPSDSHVVTSQYGYRIHPIFGIRLFHSGTDLRAQCGVPIYAAADGIVEWATAKGGHGNQVMLSHGAMAGGNTPYFSSYNHLSRFNVKKGDLIFRGDVIGYSGTTGNSTACHLHFEILKNGNTINPMTILSTL